MSPEPVVIVNPQENRYGSFTGTREGVDVRYYVDGELYFDAVAEALDQATETILIEDWWLSPQLHLRRPHMGQLTWRLDQVLKRKAEAGVKIYVVLYKEMSVALALNSEYTKHWLEQLHANIKVQRHPDHASKDATLFWAHHEKMIIVDSKIAFCGGLDLCFGRFDTPAHRLSDPTGVMWPGQDYNNVRVKDFVEVEQFGITLVDRQMTARMPWHDVSFRITGKGALDVARHFCQRWNFVKAVKAAGNVEIPMLAPNTQSAEDYAKAYPGTCRTQVCRSSSKWSCGVETERSIQNAYIELISKAEHFIYIENQFFISNATSEGAHIIANSIAAALVQRILRAVNEGKPFRVIVCMPLMPAFEDEVDNESASTLRLVMAHQYNTICRGESSIHMQLYAKGVNPADYITFYSLRNYDLIRDKKFYPKGEELLQRIDGDEVKAFKIAEAEMHPSRMHFMPKVLRDLFGKKDAEDDGSVVKTLAEVIPEGPAKNHATQDLEDNALFVTEMTYIHTKLMIVDDRYIICGSANLNDRSMCGDRDSEIAVVVEDTDLIESRMNGEAYSVGRLAFELRCQLFGEHLGLLPETHMPLQYMHGPHFRLNKLKSEDYVFQRARDAMRDPLSSTFLELWNKTAKQNTEVYRKLFRCYPDDTVTTWDELKAFKPDRIAVLPGHVADPLLKKNAIQDELHRISGHLVEFPLKFLEKEKLKADRFSAEMFMPEDVFS